MTEGIEIRLELKRPDFKLAAKLTLPGRGVTAFFGPSGSGKTTLLRALAGLEIADKATIIVNGETWQNDQMVLPTHQRQLGYVFQEASLFAHLSVCKNLEFGLQRTPRAQRRVAFDQAVQLLGLEHLQTRRPETLSGGERQRVAIARALLTSPKLLLMDEPLAALDHQRKAEILPYLENLRNELDIPLIYVSHAPDEVARLADYLVLLENGAVIAQGPLTTTLARLDLAGRFSEEAGVVVETHVAAHEDADFLSRLDFAGGSLYVNRRQVPLHQPLRCRINARDISLTLEKQTDTSILNTLPAIVTGIVDTEHPARILVSLNAGGVTLIARITRRSCRQLALEIGKPVWAQIKAVALLE